MDLLNTGYFMEQAYNIFKISDFRDLFFTPSNSAKSVAEVKAIVGGTFDPIFCSGINDFVAQREAHCLLGYTRQQASVTTDTPFCFLDSDNGSTYRFTVNSNIPWSITNLLSTDFFTLNKTSGGAGLTEVTVTAKNDNLTDINFGKVITIVGGSITVTVNIIQQHFIFVKPNPGDIPLQ